MLANYEVPPEVSSQSLDLNTADILDHRLPRSRCPDERPSHLARCNFIRAGKMAW